MFKKSIIANYHDFSISGCFEIEESWLPSHAPYMCTLGSPAEDPPPCLKEGKVFCHRSCTFGKFTLHLFYSFALGAYFLRDTLAIPLRHRSN